MDTAGEALARYLHARAGDFLRSLRLHGESGADTAGVLEATHALRQASRRIGGTLHTFRPLLDPVWADDLRTELSWLSSTLAQEHAYAARIARVLDALSRLSGSTPLPPPRGGAGGTGGTGGHGAPGAPAGLGDGNELGNPDGSGTLGAPGGHGAPHDQGDTGSVSGSGHHGTLGKPDGSSSSHLGITVNPGDLEGLGTPSGSDPPGDLGTLGAPADSGNSGELTAPGGLSGSSGLGRRPGGSGGSADHGTMGNPTGTDAPLGQSTGDHSGPPGAPGTPGVSGHLGITVSPVGPGGTDAPGAPGILGTPAGSGEPAAPGSPGAPGDLGTMGNPTGRVAPHGHGGADSLATLGDPGRAHAPGAVGKLGTPARSGSSGDQAAPRGPGNPAGPGTAGDSTKLGTRPGGPRAASARSGEASRVTGALTVGAARAGALLERQLSLARTRAHSAALQALGSARFHAVADSVAVLASELPLNSLADASTEALALPAQLAEHRLLDAVDALPLGRAAHPYNAEALVHGLAAESAGEAQDAPWHHVRLLLRLHRYAQEVLRPQADPAVDPVLGHAGLVLDRHRDAAAAATAAAAAARTPRIAPATAYALGVLHADQRHEVEAARFAFQQVWPRRAADR